MSLSRDDVPLSPEPLWRELVGEQLRAIRHQRGDTLRGVATRARVSPQYLSEIERGFKEPSSEILAAIGAAIDTSLLDLTTGVARRLHAAEAPRSADAPAVTAIPASRTTSVQVSTAVAYSLAA